ncbi:DUF3102 domain-containing protein [Aquabacter cavernae]|uniref:DUF3102 domain-containing protein n=1 Tax=Aquabacter cavernae TaxID=2496029 RepID=UPI0013E0E97E|nr:DUF3102 domain-containing protein [Aquabacter cavernae]
MAKRLPSNDTMASDVVVRFDYDQIPAEQRKALRADANAIRKSLVQALGALMDIGERLERWRDVLPHGAWRPWILAETGMSEQWARDAINVFRCFRDKSMLLEDLALPQTAIVRLSTAPEAALEDVLDRVKEGEKLQVADVDKIVKTHRKRQKDDEAAEKAKVIRASPTAADTLREMANEARDELVPQVIDRMLIVLRIIEDAEALLASTGKYSLGKLQSELHARAKWLTDALEQVTQRRATTPTKAVHTTLLDRVEHAPGPWADAAAFLRDIGHSSFWEATKAADVPALIARGKKALHGVLSSNEREKASAARAGMRLAFGGP